MTRKVKKQKLSKILLLVFALVGLNTVVKAQNIFFDANSAQENELKITPKMVKVVENSIGTFLKDVPEEMLKNYGIQNMSQLLNTQLGTPIPVYMIDNQNLRFVDLWRLPILSDDEFIALATVKHTDNEQYEVIDFGAAKLAKIIGNYEHKDRIIGILRVFEQNTDYLYIQKDNKNVFVKTFDLKGKEYSLNEIINLIKK
jgi:hypothetical protein